MLAAEAEKASELRSFEEEREELAERLATAETLASTKADGLQAAQAEISKYRQRCQVLEQQVTSAEAELAQSQEELQKAQNHHQDCNDQCFEQLGTGSGTDPSGNRMELQSVLLENAAYKDHALQDTSNIPRRPDSPRTTPYQHIPKFSPNSKTPDVNPMVPIASILFSITPIYPQYIPSLPIYKALISPIYNPKP